jgi:hypothetical protein
MLNLINKNFNMKKIVLLFFMVSAFFVSSLQKKNAANACPQLTITNAQSQYCATTCGQKVCQRWITFCIPESESCFNCTVTYTIYKASDNSFVSSVTSVIAGGCGTLLAPNFI